MSKIGSRKKAKAQGTAEDVSTKVAQEASLADAVEVSPSASATDATEEVQKAPAMVTTEGVQQAPTTEVTEGVRTKAPLILKILAVLMILIAALALPVLVLVIVSLIIEPAEFTDYLSTTSFVISMVLLASLMVSAVLGAVFGVNLLRNKLRAARHISEVLIVSTIVSLICDLMLDGFSAPILSYLVRFIILIVVATYIDPALSEERKLQRKLRDMETLTEAEDGTLGRDRSGKGYLKLDFFNIFWIFVIGCIAGVIIETIYHFMIFGNYEDRAGMLYGPFSPIYGFGAVLMTVALNRFYKMPIVLVFVISALIGGAFEYAVSWFLEFAFGILAWDYTGTWLSIGGRTNGYFMIMWGVLGCIWIKLLLPYLLKLVNLIPWNWRYSVTTLCAVLMITNGLLTLVAYDCWYQRNAGEEPNNALEQFCDTYYDNEFMENRFQSMSIDPSRATRN